MSNTKNKRGRYSRYEDAVITESIREYGTAKGLDLAAKQLSRGRDSIEGHYYNSIAVKSATPKTTTKVTTAKGQKVYKIVKHTVTETTYYYKEDDKAFKSLV